MTLSLVQLSFTTTMPTKQDGWWFMQEPGEALILDMVEHVVKALKVWRSKPGLGKQLTDLSYRNFLSRCF